MFVVIHDATHNCIFKAMPNNGPQFSLICRTLSIRDGISLLHMKHHSHLGDYDFDADLPSRWEARLFGNSALGKGLDVPVPVLQLTRLGS